MPELKEKRGLPREPVHLVAEIELDGERIGCGVSRDASAAGFLLLTHLAIPQDSRILLHLYIPGEYDPRSLAGTVVRCERIPAHEGIVWDYRLAVHLEAPPPDLKDIVLRLTKRSTKPPAAPDAP